ncbi:MAG: hypothetical protein JNL19_07935 [Burkholderiales bacterium]|nr:hypothetical protein [Burkholderiales bacterium]
MRISRHLLIGFVGTAALLLLIVVSSAHAQTPSPASSSTAEDAFTWPTITGQVRLLGNDYHAATLGPLAAANALQPGISAQAKHSATLEAEFRASGKGWNVTGTVQQQAFPGGEHPHRAWFNEAAVSRDVGGWTLSAGKKIVAWDVAYGFRPNDVVQQETRRLLVSTLAEGRPVVMAEHFNTDTAWSFVFANAGHARSERGAREPAFAARVYQRNGSADWHGFARYGAHTGASVGGALAWVATDALEVHASARYLARADSKAPATDAPFIAAANPWQNATVRRATQAIIGGTWTHESQLSVMFEVWWDGAARSPREWDTWRARNVALAALPSGAAPANAVAGNLAWQSEAFSAASNLHRRNVYLRTSWEHEGWTPSLDLLYHPSDRGQLWTAALLWKGDRVQVQGGVRINAGPATSVLRQLPTQRQAFLMGTWAF